MSFEDYKTKKSLVICYTGEGKGKTSAGLGLIVRALGNRQKVAFIQFIKYWGVNEHVFLRDISELYSDQLFFYKGGRGFFNAGELSEKNISDEDHKKAANDTYKKALNIVKSGSYDVVVCDEINNAVNDGLLKTSDLKKLITQKNSNTTLCITGRNFPKELIALTDITTDMTKIKHHFDDKFLANPGIDY